MIEGFADRLLCDMAGLDPCTAVVEAGEQDVDGLTDYGPEGHQARADLAARALRKLESMGDALPAVTPLHAHLGWSVCGWPPAHPSPATGEPSIVRRWRWVRWAWIS
ncbi:hypothetical protein ACFOOK_02275 [Micromonospora krabiensis]|nr:hypothetical protein [Micromonospora krabiensis]